MPSTFQTPPEPPKITMADCPIHIDSSDQDLALSASSQLTRAEVLSRRARRIKQLTRIYRDHYWALMEEIKLKSREYWWEYGKSPFVDGKNDNGSDDHCRLKDENDDGEDGDCSVGNMCVVEGCKTKALALTSYCLMHILLDVRQRLYKPCMFPVKRFSSMSGPLECTKAILTSAVPPYCEPHYQRAEKHMLRALKKAGLNIPSTNKLAPKFHVIIAEYVRQIQSKRRAAVQRAKLDNNANAVVIKAETNP